MAPRVEAAGGLLGVRVSVMLLLGLAMHTTCMADATAMG